MESRGRPNDIRVAGYAYGKRSNKKRHMLDDEDAIPKENGRRRRHRYLKNYFVEAGEV